MGRVKITMKTDDAIKERIYKRRKEGFSCLMVGKTTRGRTRSLEELMKIMENETREEQCNDKKATT